MHTPIFKEHISYQSYFRWDTKLVSLSRFQKTSGISEGGLNTHVVSLNHLFLWINMLTTGIATNNLISSSFTWGDFRFEAKLI